MTELTLKLESGEVIKGKAPMHFMLAEELGIDFNQIIDVGFVSKGREIWCNRGMHIIEFVEQA